MSNRKSNEIESAKKSLKLHKKMYKVYVESISALSGLTKEEIEKLSPAIKPIKHFVKRKEHAPPDIVSVAPK